MIIITGASRGIGKYLMEKFIAAGEVVYGTYNSTKPELDGNYENVDIIDHSAVEGWIDSIPNKENLVLINCAGVNYNCFAHKADIESWQRVVNVNLLGTFNVIKAILPFMRQNRYGRIINFSSIVAQTGVVGASAYSAAKAGLWGLAKTLAKENGNKNITINNLNLGYFDIGIIKEVPQNYQKVLKSNIPSGKFGNPQEILKAVTYLIETDYVNGASIDINGGLY